MSISSEVTYVACVTDAFYAKHLGVTICSLLENRSEHYPVHFLIFADQVNPKDQARLVQLIERYDCQHTFLTIDTAVYDDLSTYYHLTKATYYRTTLPDILDDHIQKILYVDCDVIVKSDIRELYDYPLNNNIIGAVDNPGFNRYDQLNIPPEAGYFNAGILLINVVLWKEQQIGAKIMNLLDNSGSSMKFGNQDSFNIVLHKHWTSLPIKWNVQREMFKDSNNYPEAFPPSIIHYTSSWKPWDYLNDHPLKQEYFNYLAKTPWKNGLSIPKDLNAKNVAKKLGRSIGLKAFQKQYW